MIRTRDFLLFLITLAFFVVVITAQTASEIFTNRGQDVPAMKSPVFSENELPNITAEIVKNGEIDRPGNIARLRDQLAYFIANQPAEPILSAPPEDVVLVATTTPKEDAVVVQGEALLCAGYAVYGGAWPKELLTIDEQEGVRVISHAKGGVAESGVITILPIRKLGNALASSCLPTDVVAVAQSGNLIRNNEASGYRAFPEHVLIGYTLDGFKLYGFSSKETDHCGGIMVDGEYRYYLSADRESVMNCFVAPPVKLPQ